MSKKKQTNSRRTKENSQTFSVNYGNREAEKSVARAEDNRVHLSEKKNPEDDNLQALPFPMNARSLKMLKKDVVFLYLSFSRLLTEWKKTEMSEIEEV